METHNKQFGMESCHFVFKTPYFARQLFCVGRREEECVDFATIIFPRLLFCLLFLQQISFFSKNPFLEHREKGTQKQWLDILCPTYFTC